MDSATLVDHTCHTISAISAGVLQLATVSASAFWLRSGKRGPDSAHCRHYLSLEGFDRKFLMDWRRRNFVQPGENQYWQQRCHFPTLLLLHRQPPYGQSGFRNLRKTNRH